MFEKFVKECFIIALLLFLIFVMENYNYYFHYLPHREDYDLVEAQKSMFQPKSSRNIEIFFYDGKEKVQARVPEAANDAGRDIIRVEYSRLRSPHVIRADYIIKKELCVIGILVILLQIRRYFLLKKYWDELTGYPKQKKS